MLPRRTNPLQRSISKRRTNPLHRSFTNNTSNMSKHHSSSSSSSSNSTTDNTLASTTKKDSSSLVILFRLIEANDWRKINSIFLSDQAGQKTFQHLASIVSKSNSFNGMTILHACCRFNPPSILISKMIDLCPSAPAAQDVLGRTPLHVAAGTGASSSVIKVLVDCYPAACMVQDTDGRTPLHMAADSSTELFEESTFEKSAPSHRTIGILLQGSLESATLEDEDGMSAIEYALFSNAELNTVRLIQKAAQKVLVRQQKEAEEERRRSSSCTDHSEPQAINVCTELIKNEETKEDRDANARRARDHAVQNFNLRGSLTMVARSA